MESESFFFKSSNIQDFSFSNQYNKNSSINKLRMCKVKTKYSYITNFLLFNIIFFSFLKKNMISCGYIEIQVNKEGLNQIISDEYTGNLTYKVYINENLQNLNGSSIEVDNINYKIKLEWSCDTFSNFAYMFSNLQTITYAKLYYIFSSNDDIDLFYMFKNCTSLSQFHYTGSRYSIRYLQGMFYGCNSLKSVDINSFQFYSSSTDISYMFYNCKILETINMPSFGSDFGISNMYQMFYNCESLKDIRITLSKRFSNYLDMSQLFYNCKNLENIDIDFNYLFVTNSKEMFYNCQSLKNINYRPEGVLNNNINMSGMFYNCTSIKNITLHNDYFYPNDMSNMFYNCNELISLKIEGFNTENVHDMSYMLYNCEKLKYFDISYSTFSNTLITNMKGMFQNLISLENLDLTNFKTPKVEIMWNMFKGCTNLVTLKIPNFDTSEVTDMQSMFEGCSNLISLNIDNFITTKVQYMNKMFKDCESLKSLYFKSLTTESLGTMYQMFYNCRSLEYLNLYSLTESGQSLQEMFNGSSYSFELCIYDEKNIPNIFQELYPTSFKRVCNSSCYGSGKYSIPSKKSCCLQKYYNSQCFDQCPIRTYDNGNKICRDLNCPNYYSYDQKSCINAIPQGYFLNHTNLKTIDKCHENCTTCFNKSTDTSTNCLTCVSDLPYIYLGNCYSTCKFGVYYDPIENKYKCKCFDEKCILCSEESLRLGLCITCNEGYYPKIDDIITDSRFINCYKKPEQYYLDTQIRKYKKCYQSCKFCTQSGNVTHNYCTECNLKYSYSLPIINDETLLNCYPDCVYNFYFNDDNTYICLSEPGCPQTANLLIDGTKRCVNSCKGLKNKYEFQGKCYFECPDDSTKVENDTDFYCIADCPIERPFEMVETQICVSYFKIMDRYNKLCITSYRGNDTFFIHDMVMTSVLDDIVDTFDYHFITNNRSLILDEEPFVYEITSTNCSYVNPELGRVNLKECEYELKDYYGIPRNDTLYILKVDANIPGKIGPKVQYEVYYPFDGVSLHNLDISICEGILISIEVPINITIDNIDKYDRHSPFYNDICYTYTNENGSDVTLEDRLDEFIRYNRSVCDEDCRLVGVDSTGERAECSCEINFNVPFVSQITIDKNKLYKFINIKNIANFKMFVCYKLFFSAKGIKINIGYYCLLFILVVYFICLFYFYIKEYKLIKLIINEIVYAKKNEKYLDKKFKERKTEKSKKSAFQNFLENKKLKTLFEVEETQNREIPIIHSFKKTKINQEDKINVNPILNTENIKSSYKLDTIKDKAKKENNNLETVKKTSYKETKASEENSNKFLNKIIKKNNAPPKKKPVTRQQKIKNEGIGVDSTSKKSYATKSLFFKKESLNITNNKNNEKFNEKQKKKIRYILSYIDVELNDLGYKKAIKLDHRQYYQYYISLLKSNHPLFKIFNKRDYNAFSIKILLFFFDFASNYAVNALFFNDETMHQIYNDGGDFNFIYQLPQIIYSTIISIIIDSIISFLGLSQDDILSIKHIKDCKNIERRAKEVIRTLHIKFIIFFIITFCFIILYWYYLGCFCAVYINTQFHLIKDTLIGYGTSTITPLGKFLIPGLFRIPALKINSKGNKLVYQLSQFLQKF